MADASTQAPSPGSPAPPDPERPPAGGNDDATRRFLAGVAILLLLLPLTWALRAWQVADVSEELAEEQADAVRDALAYVEADFAALEEELLDRARSIASEPVVVAGLRERLRHGLAIGPEPLVTSFVERSLPLRMAVELYDLTPRLAAWNGFGMPLDAGPSSPRFLESYQTAVVSDGQRRVLVVWWPVREGGRVLGAVRVMQLIGFEAPVQNEYLRDFSLEERWQRATRLPVEVSYDDLDAAPPRMGTSRLLEGADGTPILRVSVAPPTADRLVTAAAERFDHVLAFWATLLFGWIVAGLWGRYREAMQDHREGAGASPVTRRAALRFAAAASATVGLRYLLLALDVPARWQRAKAPLAPIFDPSHFASTLGGGLFRSAGDLLLTALFALALAGAFVQFASRFRVHGLDAYRSGASLRARRPERTGVLLTRAVLVVLGLASFGLVLALATLAHHAVLDSTLDYFAREGLLPEPLVLVIFGTMLLLTAATLLMGVGVTWIGLWSMARAGTARLDQPKWWIEAALLVMLPPVLTYLVVGPGPVLPGSVAAAFLGVIFSLAVFGFVRQGSWLEVLILRSVLPTVFLLTVLLYPLLFGGMEVQQRLQMRDAAELFGEGRDPRVLFAIEQVLRDVGEEARVGGLLASAPRADSAGRPLDSLATDALRSSLLGSLAAYEVSLTLFDTTRVPLGRYQIGGLRSESSALDEADVLELDILLEMYEESGTADVLVEQVTGRRDPARFQYEGVAPIRRGGALVGWAMVRAEPQQMPRDGGTPFPRVLLPYGSYDDLYADLSVAEFKDGALVREIGREFGRYRMAEEVQQALLTQPVVWRTENVDERTYRTLYRRQAPPPAPEGAPSILPAASATVVAVRVPAVNIFDHLFYLLRLTVAGLFVALPLYVVGLTMRWRAGLLPAPRVRYRDKVLNAFLTVGIITVGAVGFVGLGVVTAESERAVQSWLRQHLEQVEVLLALEARADEMPYRVLERTGLDSVAARVGFDLNVYQGYDLVGTSRPQLVRERLIEERLPIEAYRALYFEGYRFITTEERVGSFAFTAGFQALPDEQGRPHYILSVPTLPEQEQIEEERARTVAYLFGALLLLVLVVMLTASLLANALARPVARLRSGLQDVARGRFERMLPVDSRDEIGELVQTFNEMQEQLAESRRRLAQQERQLAWREMARQVAHEIKNPLTPMKLSVQHLRRAFDGALDDPEQRSRFAKLFERITQTLIEQTDTLARIANEFHSFARMPSRMLERLNLNLVVEEAVALMQEESPVEIRTNLYPEPLVVEADHEELRRNYINLIKNAIQAIPDEREAQVVVTTARVEQDGAAWALSTVTDNGAGVPEALRDRIFEPNFSTKTSGTGLGLAIVRKSVEELHGEIGFETREEEGSSFWFRLPLAEDV